MTVVIDASVIIKWLLQDPRREPDTAEATSLMDAVLRGQLKVIQPFHWLAEVAAVLSRLSPRTVDEDIVMVQALGLPVTDEPTTLGLACRLAVKLNAHVFDTLYHAVALDRAGAVLITADNSYLREARGLGRVAGLRDWRTAVAG